MGSRFGVLEGGGGEEINPVVGYVVPSCFPVHAHPTPRPQVLSEVHETLSDTQPIVMGTPPPIRITNLPVYPNSQYRLSEVKIRDRRRIRCIFHYPQVQVAWRCDLPSSLRVSRARIVRLPLECLWSSTNDLTWASLKWLRSPA